MTRGDAAGGYHRRVAAKRSASPSIDAAHRIVILRGPDRFIALEWTRRLREALEAAHGGVGVFTYDGRNANPAEVLDECRSFGLLDAHKMVIVENADQFLAAGKDDDAPTGRGAATTRSILEEYAKEPVPSATLVLRSETWRPGRLDKAVAKVGTIIKCEPPNAAAAERAVQRRAQDPHGVAIAPRAASMLVELIGPDLGRLDVEIAKLAAFVGSGGTIDEEAVRTLVGLSREEKAWIIQEAILARDPAHALRVLRELLEVSLQPEQPILWAIHDLLIKIHAAGHRLRAGASPGDVARELRLWGAARDGVLGAAKRLDPREAAALLSDSIAADRGGKSGLGQGRRTLEVLTVRIADRLKRT